MDSLKEGKQPRDISQLPPRSYFPLVKKSQINGNKIWYETTKQKSTRKWSSHVFISTLQSSNKPIITVPQSCLWSGIALCLTACFPLDVMLPALWHFTRSCGSLPRAPDKLSVRSFSRLGAKRVARGCPEPP